MTLSCSAAEPADDKQYVFVGGTLEATLSDTITQASIPMFPGIPASKVRGKSFRILINDLHQIENGKIKNPMERRYHSNRGRRMNPPGCR